MKYRPIYLNDHLAGATLGVELAKRTLGSNRDGELGDLLRWLLGQLVDDRATLLTIIKQQGGRVSLGKAGGGWLAEKLGRLKLNGHVTTYSPLSRLVELEALASGIEAKKSMWLALQAGGVDGLDELVARAAEQRERLEPHRIAAARLALS